MKKLSKVSTTDYLSNIDEEIGDARIILQLKHFSERKSSDFEQFLQLFSAAFEAKRTSSKDIDALTAFLNRISTSKKTKSERVDLFLLTAAMLKQHKDRTPALENSLLKRIVDNNGCLEYDPLTVIYSGSSITTTSTTLVGFEPEFHSSYYLPSQVVGQKAKELFQERIRLLYTEIAKLSHDLNSLSATAFIQSNFEDFLFELYENILDHAKNSETNKTPSVFPRNATFWYVRLERIAVPTAGLIDCLPNHEIYKEYARELQLRRGKKPKLLVTVSVYDNGPGIYSYYNSKNLEITEPRDFFGFETILLEKRTSKTHPGAGWGVRRAMDCIAQLDGFVTIRSNEFWAGKLPNEENFRNLGKELGVTGHTSGTLYSIVLPVW